MPSRRLGLLGLVGLLAACGAPRPSRAPCYAIHADSELRAHDARAMLEGIAGHIRLAPEDEALRHPTSIAEIKTILHRDIVYFFANAAVFARSLDTLDGRVSEAELEVLLGESQLIASQVLSTQQAWIGADLRIARANLASEVGDPDTDRGRMLTQLIRVVEEGNKIGDALGVVAPSHLARGAEVIRRLRVEAPTDLRTLALVAEYHRLRGEWAQFDGAMKTAEAADRATRALCYLRGMEQLERFRRPDVGARILRGCLTSFPNFVRAQAGLVLMATSAADGLRELAALKWLNQDHYLVMLLEPTLAADAELLRMQSGGPPDGSP